MLTEPQRRSAISSSEGVESQTFGAPVMAMSQIGIVTGWSCSVGIMSRSRLHHLPTLDSVMPSLKFYLPGSAITPSISPST